MKCISKGLLPALMVSMILFSSCSKEIKVVAPTNNIIEQISPQPMQGEGGWPTIFGVNYNLRLVVVKHDLLTGEKYYSCPYRGGRCLKTVVIKGKKLSEKLQAGPAVTATYFSGEEWKEHFSDEIVAHQGFVDFMTSGAISYTIGEGEEGDEYFMLGYKDDAPINKENALCIIPIAAE